MLNLNPGPQWLDLMPGVRAEFRPLTTAMFIRAREKSRAVVRAADLPDEREAVDPDVMAEVQYGARRALVESVTLAGLIAWEGVGDAEGDPVEPTPDWVAALLDNYAAFESIERKYLGPLLEAEAEKNASSPSPGGTSTPRAAKTTAAAASPSTATPAPSAPGS